MRRVRARVAVNVASAARSRALPATCVDLAAAWLSATAPMTAGPRLNPKSRSLLVVAVAMPARWLGMVLTAMAVTEETAKANPMPASTSGAMIGASDMPGTGTADSHRLPAPIRANPRPSTPRGFNGG